MSACVWAWWSLIRAGYGKQRLKPWIMEKLIRSMDQQGTLNIQHTHTRTHIVSHTHMHTHTYNQFTKLGLRENTVTVISNNYDPKASTFQCQRLNSASSLSCVWVKTFYCSFWDPHSLSKDWSPWVKHLRVNYCGTSTGRPSGLLVLSCP